MNNVFFIQYIQYYTVTRRIYQKPAKYELSRLSQSQMVWCVSEYYVYDGIVPFAGINVSIPILYAFNYAEVDELILIVWMFTGPICFMWILRYQTDESDFTHGRHSDTFYTWYYHNTTGFNPMTFYKVTNTILFVIALAQYLFPFLFVKMIHSLYLIQKPCTRKLQEENKEPLIVWIK